MTECSDCKKWKERCQKLEKMASRVPDEVKPCKCPAPDGRSSHASTTGFICYNCGGSCKVS